MEAIMSTGGWGIDRQPSTGTSSFLINCILVAGLLVSQGTGLASYQGTGLARHGIGLARQGTGDVSDDLGALRKICIQESQQNFNFIVEDKYARSPTEDLKIIRETLQPAVSDLATYLQVSRQAVYNWQKGEQPSIEHATKLKELASAAEIVAASGNKVSGYSLKRKIFNGKNFFETVQEGITTEEAIKSLLQVIDREAKQRDLMSSRISGRSVSQHFADSDPMQANDEL